MLTPPTIEIFVELGQNIALLVTLTFLYSLFRPIVKHMRPRTQAIVNGLLFAIFALAVMLTPITLAPGILLDGRGVMIGLAGAFGGWIPALITATVVTPVRLLIGGDGTSLGVGFTLTSALMGILLYHNCGKRRAYTAKDLLLFGLGIALVYLAWMVLLESNIRIASIEASTVPVLVMYPIGCFLLGTLLSHENQRAQLEERMRVSDIAFRTGLSGIVIVDGSGIITSINPAAVRLFGYADAKTLTGQPVSCITADMRQQSFVRRMAPVVPDEQRFGYTYETEGRRFDGTIFPMTLSLSSVADEDGSASGFVIAVYDISQHRLAEQRASELATEKSRGEILRKFINDASHDLGTPITTLVLSSYILEKYTEEIRQHAAMYTGNNPAVSAHIQETAHKIEERIQMQKEAVARLDQLVKDLLDMVRMDTATHFAFAVDDLNGIVKQVIDSARQSIAAKELSVEFTPDTALAPVRVDRDLIIRLIHNLLSNAVQFTPDGGTIRLKTYRVATVAVISVQDTGMGIADADMPHIFERFYRADKARGSETGGTGMGLAIAQKIAEIHHGRIDVESAVGTGSTFRVLLPYGDIRALPASSLERVTTY